MLNIQGINVYYGNIHAIKDVSFHVHRGEIVTLIGANGAGKSTVLKTISGLQRTKTGEITFGRAGHPHDRAAQDRRHGAGARAGGAPRVFEHDRGGKPRDGRVYPADFRRERVACGCV